MLATAASHGAAKPQPAKKAGVPAYKVKKFMVHFVKPNDPKPKRTFYERLAHQALREPGSDAEWTVPPMVDGAVVDLYLLHQLVTARGGSPAVTLQRQWGEVAAEMQSPGIDSDCAMAIYLKYLEPHKAGIAPPDTKADTTNEPQALTEPVVEDIQPVFEAIHMMKPHALLDGAGGVDWQRVVLALQSTLEREVAWALNLTASVAYYQTVVLQGVPGLLQALLFHLEDSLSTLLGGSAADGDSTGDDLLSDVFRPGDEAQEAAAMRLRCLLTTFLCLALQLTNAAPLGENQRFVACLVACMPLDEDKISAHDQETAFAVLATVSQSIRLHELAAPLRKDVLNGILQWIDVCEKVPVSEEPYEPEDKIEKDLEPGPHQWYISYLVMESLAKLTVKEEHHDSFSALPRDDLARLCDWLLQQAMLFGTQRSGIALVVLTNLAATPKIGRLMATKKPLIKAMLFLADPPPDYPYEVSPPWEMHQQRAALILTYLVEALPTVRDFAPYEEALVEVCTGFGKDPQVVQYYSDILFQLSW